MSANPRPLALPDDPHAEATRRVRQNVSAGLAAPLSALRRLRAGRRLAELAFFFALWIAGATLGLANLEPPDTTGWIARAAGVLIAAAALNAIYLASHEGHHRLLFRNRRVNDIATFLLCAPLLHGATAYRVLHEQHHWHLGGPGDPDDYRNYTRNRRSIWALHWARLLFGTWFYLELIPIVGWRRASAADRPRIAIEYALLLPAWAAVLMTWPLDVLLQAWLLPGVLVCYFSAIRALAQHALTTREDPFAASRSVRSGPIVSFLLLNENYHLEHHLFPEVPSYNLPALRRLIAPRLPRAVEDVSYTRFLARFLLRSIRGDDSVLGLEQHS